MYVGFDHLVHGQILPAHCQPLQLHDVVVRMLRVAQQRRVVQACVCRSRQAAVEPVKLHFAEQAVKRLQLYMDMIPVEGKRDRDRDGYCWVIPSTPQ